MRRSRVIQTVAAVGLIVPLCTGSGEVRPAAGKDRGALRPGAIVERATSELVLIEVYVTDRQGRPIRDLTVDDFILKVDQQTRPKPLASLEYVEGIQGMPPREVQGEGAEPEAADAPAPRGEPRRFVLFFEDGTSAPSGLTAARRAAEEFVASGLAPSDLVALAAYDLQRKLRVLLDFTTDREALRAALRASLEDRNRFSDFSSERDQRRNEIRKAQMTASTGIDTDGEYVRLLGRNYAREDAARMGGVLRAVRTLIEALAPWPGYKAIVFMGEGVPENPAEDYALLDPQQSLVIDLKGLAYAAGSAGITLNTVQTTGLVAGDADEVGSASRRSNALSTLALGTGGVALTTNDLAGALGDVEASSHAYYLLGYAPEGPPDGLYHTVNIKVKTRGATLRYRRGFTRLLPDEARERTIQAAHLVPELYRSLGLQLSSVPGPVGGADRVADLVLYVPADRLLFIPGEGGPTARLEIGLVALGESGKESLKIARRVRVAIPSDLAESWDTLGLNLFSRVHLPAAGQSVTAVVSDLQGGATGAARLSVAAGGREGIGVLGLSVYSMTERSLWIDLNPDGDPDPAGESAAAFTLGPALRNRFAAGEPLACGFRLPGPGAAGLQVAIMRDGRVVRTKPLDPQEAAHGTIKVGLPVEGLPAGDYLLLVQEEGTGGATERGRVPFTIEPSRPKASG